MRFLYSGSRIGALLARCRLVGRAGMCRTICAADGCEIGQTVVEQDCYQLRSVVAGGGGAQRPVNRRIHLVSPDRLAVRSGQADGVCGDRTESGKT